MLFASSTRKLGGAFASSALLVDKAFAGHIHQRAQSTSFRTVRRTLSARQIPTRSIVMKSPVQVSTEKTEASVAGPTPYFAQCMLRVADDEKSRDFYENKLGMKFLTRIDFDDAKFSLLFFAYTDDDAPDMSLPRAERSKWLWTRPYPTIELTYNWDSDEVYVNGNDDVGLGFGYNSVVVDDAKKVVDQLAKAGVKVVKNPEPFNGVSTYGIVQDPDGYWVQILNRSDSSSDGSQRGIVGRNPVFSHVLLRVADPNASITFFQKLGMKYIFSVDFPESSFSSYFLTYTDIPHPPGEASTGGKMDWLLKYRGCCLELRNDWLDENETPAKYSNGNQQGARGFGHIGILVDDCAHVTKSMESEGYKVVRKAGPFKDVAVMSFVASPVEEYWVEIIERTKS